MHFLLFVYPRTCQHYGLQVRKGCFEEDPWIYGHVHRTGTGQHLAVFEIVETYLFHGDHM